MPISKLQGENVISPLFIHHATLDPELLLPRHDKRSMTEDGPWEDLFSELQMNLTIE